MIRTSRRPSSSSFSRTRRRSAADPVSGISTRRGKHPDGQTLPCYGTRPAGSSGQGSRRRRSASFRAASTRSPGPSSMTIASTCAGIPCCGQTNRRAVIMANPVSTINSAITTRRRRLLRSSAGPCSSHGLQSCQRSPVASRYGCNGRRFAR